MTGQGRSSRRYRYTQDMQLQFLALRNDSRKSAEYNEALVDLIRLIRAKWDPPMNWSHIEQTIPHAPLPLRWEGVHADLVYAHPNGHIVYLMQHTQPWSRVKAAVLAAMEETDGEDPV